MNRQTSTRRDEEQSKSSHLNPQNNSDPDVFDAVRRAVRTGIIRPLRLYNRHTGGNANGTGEVELHCPFPSHDDKDPSFSLNADTGLWICHGCGDSGDIIDLFIELNGACDELNAAKQLAEDAGISYRSLSEEEKEKREKQQEKQEKLEEFINYTADNLTDEHKRYLHNRGLTDETIERYKIGFEPSTSPEDKEAAEQLGLQTNRYKPAGRYILPVYQHNRPSLVVLHKPTKQLEGDERKYDYPKGCTRPLWGVDSIEDPDDPVYLVEGWFDYVTVEQSGLQALATFGKLKNDHANKIRQIGHNDLRIMFDPDATGDAWKDARDLWPDVKADVVELDEMDPNDLYLNSDSDDEKFHNHIQEANKGTILSKQFDRFRDADNKHDAKGDLFELIRPLEGTRQDDAVSLIQDVTGWNKKHIREEINVADNGRGSTLEATEILLDNEGVPGGLIEPDGWRVESDGLYKSLSSDEKKVCASPVVVTQRLVDAGRETEQLELTWKRGGRWRSEIVPRQQAMNSRELVELSGKGFPIDTGNSREIVEYLSAFEAVNLNKIPSEVVTTSMGWTEDKKSFVIGDHILPESEEGLQFHAIDAGHDEIAQAFRTEGALDTWKKSLEPLHDFPKVLLPVYASFSTPLLEILDAQNPIIELAGRTSRGKTTTQRICASVWGDPREDSPSSVLRTWANTSTYIERLSTLLDGLPLILDDTQNAQDDELVESVFYQVRSGQGKGRGTIEGMAETGTWRTALISSGEKSITEISDNSGAVARSLTLRGSPFGSVNDETAAVVSKLNQSVFDNYGHAGPRFVKWLLNNREQWSDLQDEYKEMKQHYADRAADLRGPDPVANRYAETLALLDVTAATVHAADLLPFSYSQTPDDLLAPIVDVMDDLLKGAEKADDGKQAMRLVLDWIYSNRNRFYGGDMMKPDEEDEPDAPHGGWYGVHGDLSDGEGIGIFRKRLRTVLKEDGFSPEQVFRSWRERGWINPDRDDIFTRPKYFAPEGNHIRMVVINGDKSDELPM
jgi:transcriptional regulator with XRE-family HTH domain